MGIELIWELGMHKAKDLLISYSYELKDFELPIGGKLLLIDIFRYYYSYSDLTFKSQFYELLVAILRIMTMTMNKIQAKMKY